MRESLITGQSDRDEDIEDNDKFKERELKGFSSTFPLLLPIILTDQTYVPVKLLIQHLEKVKFLFRLLCNLIGKHMHFLKTIPLEETLLMRKDKSQ